MMRACSPGSEPGPAALATLLGVVERLLVGALGDGDTLLTDAQAGVVHHGEHVLHALVLVAHEVADGAVALLAVRHRAGRRGVDPHLVLDGDAGDVVVLAERAVVVHEELRHHEQRDALGAGGGVRRAGQDQVDDLVGELVLAEGDVDLLALDQVRAVVLRHGLGRDRADVRACLRLGEVHRPGPLAGDHLRQVGLLELVAGVVAHGVHRARGQQRAERERQVRGVEHLLERRRDHQREATAAELGGLAERGPPGLDVLVVDPLERVRQRDLAVLGQLRALLVPVTVGRGDGLRAEAAGLLEQRPDHVGVGVREGVEFGELGQPREVLEDEAHVTDGGGVVTHVAERTQRHFDVERPSGPSSARHVL